MSERPKEPYVPPEVRLVKLAKEEMAAGSCKRTDLAPGPYTGCFRPPVPCRVRGS